MVTIGFNETDINMLETNNTVTLNVAVLDGVVGTPISVSLSTIDQSAMGNYTDYIHLPGSPCMAVVLLCACLLPF